MLSAVSLFTILNHLVYLPQYFDKSAPVLKVTLFEIELLSCI